MKDEDKKKCILIPIKPASSAQDSGYIIQVQDDHIDTWVPLHEYREFCFENKIMRHYNYFLALIELATSLCY